MKTLIASLLLLVGGPVWACTLEAPSTLTIPSPTGPSQTLKGYAQITAECPQGTPYQIEIENVRSGGSTVLTNTDTGEAVSARVFHGDTKEPFGALAQGEAISEVGTGSLQGIPMEVHVEIDAIPSAGRYEQSLQIIMIF